MKRKSGFRFSCSVRRKLFEECITTALTPNILGISTFLGFLKSGGNLNGVTAMWRPIYLYLNFYRVSVKSITHFKIVIALYIPALPFRWKYRFNLCRHISNWSITISLIQVNTVCYVCIRTISIKTAWCDYYGQFYKTSFTVVNGLNIINYICNYIVNHSFSVIS